MTVRYRCSACGNLTRFTVTRFERVRGFHHFTLGGEMKVEDPEVLEDNIEEVLCRWCNHGNNIQISDEEGNFPP